MVGAKERRGVVLIDPPFEEPGEFGRLVEGLAAARRRFATGTVIIWYPIKDQRIARGFSRDVAALAIPKLLSAELFVRAPMSEGELTGTGLLIQNPPFTLEAKLALLLPYLAASLARGKGAEHRLAWLAGERVTSS
jgi:23S rRNA (adenine2030-N6)-methyltransferase